MSEVRIFVAGATGYTGTAVVDRARKAGHNVLAHIRPRSASGDKAASQFASLGAEISRAPWELEPIAKALAEFAPTHLFGLLGTTRHRAKKEGFESATKAYREIDFGLTKMLIDACENAAPSAKFVYLSAIGVSEKSSSAYMKARWDAESALTGSTLRHMIVRPSFITGSNRPEDRPGERIGSVVADAALGFASLLGAKRTAARFKSLTNHELAASMLAAALSERENCVVETDALRDFL